MPAPTKFSIFPENLGKGVHNLLTNTLKVMLTNTAPVIGNTVKANLTEIAAANGYVAGGAAAVVTSFAQTAGVAKLVLADTTVVTATGAVGPFRYAVLYDDTPTSPADPLIAFIDHGSSITLAAGETYTVDWDQAAGAITIT